MTRNFFCLFSVCCVLALNVLAENTQPKEDHSNSFSVGYDVGSIANGIAYGIRFASPAFFNDIMRVSGQTHMGWAQNVIPNKETEARWLSYGLVRLGLSGGMFLGELPIRAMGVAELAVAIPDKTISGKRLVFGLAGSMDFEFFADPYRHHAIILNMGGQGLFKSTAENLQGSPTFGNGFLAAFGYRYYF